MKQQRRLTVEALEDRVVPATWNTPWPDASRLTLSFMPDGTKIGQQESNLFATLNALTSTTHWQRQILRAFQNWVIHANINIGLVADEGQAYGTNGKPQSDSRFGDIRLGAATYGDSVIAFSSPFDILASTAAGDVRINSTMFQDRTFDLFTAMLQEAGHTLGIGNSADPSSAMYEEYLGPRLGLSNSDIAAIQALYGPRPADEFEGRTGNETLATAAPLSLIKDADGILSVSLRADLTTPTDGDVYSFRAPTLTSGLLLRLHRAGISLVTPRVTVFDSTGRVIGSTETTDPTSGDLLLRLSNIRPLALYYVRVEGVGEELFRVGSYGLTIQSLTAVNSLLGSTFATVNDLGSILTNVDLHTNDSFLTATGLLGSLFAPDSRFDVAYHASIHNTQDVDFYRLQSPKVAVGDNVMTVMVWGTGTSELLPKVSVFDAARNPVEAEVLVNDGGILTVQVIGVKPDSTYFVKVEAAVKTGRQAVGNYFLGIDFSDRAIRLKTFAQEQLGSSRPESLALLQVHRTAMFHFVLETDSSAGVELEIRDLQGELIRVIRSTANDSRSLTVTLDAGFYTFALRSLGTSLANYHLKGTIVTDPIGPRPKDSSGDSNTSQTTGGSSGDAKQDWFYDSYWYYWYPEQESGSGVKSQSGDSGYRG